MIQAHGTDTSALAAGITSMGAKKIADKRKAAEDALEMEKEQKRKAEKVNKLFKEATDEAKADKERYDLKKGRIDRKVAEHANELKERREKTMRKGDILSEVDKSNEEKIKKLESQRAGSKINKEFAEAEELLKKLKGKK